MNNVYSIELIKENEKLKRKAKDEDNIKIVIHKELTLKYTFKDIFCLTLGMLLHDIGKTKVLDGGKHSLLGFHMIYDNEREY